MFIKGLSWGRKNMYEIDVWHLWVMLAPKKTFENLVETILDHLVETILDQLKISMTFEISECLGSQYYHSLLNLFLIKICSF